MNAFILKPMLSCGWLFRGGRAELPMFFPMYEMPPFDKEAPLKKRCNHLVDSAFSF